MHIPFNKDLFHLFHGKSYMVRFYSHAYYFDVSLPLGFSRYILGEKIGKFSLTCNRSSADKKMINFCLIPFLIQNQKPIKSIFTNGGMCIWFCRFIVVKHVWRDEPSARTEPCVKVKVYYKR
jgi:hypothetical protein